MIVPAITRNSFIKEAHPWGYYIPEGATRLLIGTFPSELKNRKQSFFYCSTSNRFWNILAQVASVSVSTLTCENAVKDRQDLLSALQLGLTDMGKVVLRQLDSSNDHSLFPLEFMDIIQLLWDHPTIQTLIVSGDMAGNSSLSWLATYCSLNNVKIKLRELKDSKRITIRMADREIAILLGYSTSRNSRKKDQELLASYKNMLI